MTVLSSIRWRSMKTLWWNIS